MFGIGGFELFIILLFGFLVFGPDKLPALAKTLGQAIAKFRSAQQEMSTTLKEQVFDPKADQPFKDPTDVIAKVTDTATQTAKSVAQTARETLTEVANTSRQPSSTLNASSPTSTSPSNDTGSSNTPSFAQRKAQYEQERQARAETAQSDNATTSPSCGDSTHPDDTVDRGEA